MKAYVKKKLIFKIEAKLDSSEAVMFQQGGEYRTTLPLQDIMSIDLMDCIANEINETELLLTFQIEKSQMGRHTHIITENAKAVWKPDEATNSV